MSQALRLSRPFQLVWAATGAEVHPLDPSALAALTYVAPERTVKPSDGQGGDPAAAGTAKDASEQVVDDIDVEEREAVDVLHVALGEQREGGEPAGAEPGGEPKQA